MSEDLHRFIGEGLRQGASREALTTVLLQAGWREEQVRRALAGFADVEFPIPVPRPRAMLSARETFIYLVLFTTLYITAYQLGSLLFDLVNLALPDPAQLDPQEYARQSIRWSVSSLVVAFPIFAYMTWRAGQLERLDRAKRASSIRRNLTYLTLFVAACILIGDVTLLVYNFLGGELTLRFVSKVLIAGLIAGAVFHHYRGGLREEERETEG